MRIRRAPNDVHRMMACRPADADEDRNRKTYSSLAAALRELPDGYSTFKSALEAVNMTDMLKWSNFTALVPSNAVGWPQGRRRVDDDQPVCMHVPAHVTACWRHACRHCSIRRRW